MDLRKTREFQENICFIDYAKAFDCVDHNKQWKILKAMGPLLGARVRYSARGKGHEEGGSTYAKAGSSLRSPPGNPGGIYPHNQSLPTLLLCAFTYTSDFTGGCPPPPLSEKELI